MSKEYTEEEIAEHCTEKDCWIILGNDSNGGQKVYDVTSYLEEHPGGPEIIMEFAGKEADDMFEDIGHSKEARQAQKKLLIGSVKASGNKDKKPKTSAKASSSSEKQGGLNPLAIVAILVAIVAGIYFSQMKQ
mmetsp:Transcript_14826/g.32352  ORF Transcript_14826/g.32352 Transcript_14826/m.32352 type:complete len:133 (+) Transcript_14826:39-437(+)